MPSLSSSSHGLKGSSSGMHSMYSLLVLSYVGTLSVHDSVKIGGAGVSWTDGAVDEGDSNEELTVVQTTALVLPLMELCSAAHMHPAVDKQYASMQPLP